jgi:protein-tyrosine phosphatase
MSGIKKAMNYMTAPVKVVADKSTEYNLKQLKNNENTDVIRLFPRPSVWSQLVVFFKSPTHIIDNIYLGSAFNAASYYKLKKLNIGLVINMTREISMYYPDDFIYKQYDLYDNNKESIKEYLEKALADIYDYQKQNPDQNILIHCFMGASRSASIVIYYLIHTKRKEDGSLYSFDDAVEFVKNKRHIINPTKIFQSDIIDSCELIFNNNECVEKIDECVEKIDESTQQ